MYSTIVEIVEEETENEEVLSEDGTEGVSSINVKGLNEQLLNMVDEIEQSDREREKEKKAVVIEVQKKKEDPYNRSVNYHSTSFDDLDTIEISDDVAIETIVSESGRRKN